MIVNTIRRGRENDHDIYLVFNKQNNEVTYFLENVSQCKKSNQVSTSPGYQIKDEILYFQLYLYIVVGRQG